MADIAQHEQDVSLNNWLDWKWSRPGQLFKLNLLPPPNKRDAWWQRSSKQAVSPALLLKSLNFHLCLAALHRGEKLSVSAFAAVAYLASSCFVSLNKVSCFLFESEKLPCISRKKVHWLFSFSIYCSAINCKFLNVCPYLSRCCPSALESFLWCCSWSPGFTKPMSWMWLPRKITATLQSICQQNKKHCADALWEVLWERVAHRCGMGSAPCEALNWNLALLHLPAPVSLFSVSLSLSLLQETQGETPGSFLRRTQPEGLQHQRTWPTVQTSLSAPVQPPLPQGTAPRPPTSVRFQQPRWSDCVDPIRTGMHAFFENSAPDRMMYDEPRLINLLALVLGAVWATVRGLWRGIKTR